MAEQGSNQTNHANQERIPADITQDLGRAIAASIIENDHKILRAALANNHPDERTGQ